MADDTITPEDGENEVTYKFSSNPAAESILVTINEQAEYYRLAVGILTGKFDQNYAEWKTAQKIDKTDRMELPDTSALVEWMHIDANLSELLAFREVMDKLSTELNLAIFGYYAEKNVRGAIHHKLEDLKDLRKALIVMLDGTITTCANVPFLKDHVTLEVIESIPSVGKQKPFGDGKVWNFPDAPTVETTATDKAAAAHGTNLRKHNSNVKFVVDGVFHDEDTAILLGDLCEKYFSKNTQQVRQMFDGWSKEYFSDGEKEPAKAVIRDGVKYWLTYYTK